MTLQCDEAWSFVGDKGNKQWIWLALDVTTREIVGVYIGERINEGVGSRDEGFRNPILKSRGFDIDVLGVAASDLHPNNLSFPRINLGASDQLGVGYFRLSSTPCSLLPTPFLVNKELEDSGILYPQSIVNVLCVIQIFG